MCGPGKYFSIALERHDDNKDGKPISGTNTVTYQLIKLIALAEGSNFLHLFSLQRYLRVFRLMSHLSYSILFIFQIFLILHLHDVNSHFLSF